MIIRQDDDEEEDAGDEETADDDFGDFEGGGNGTGPEGPAAGKESLATLVQEELPSLSKHWLAALKERFVDDLLHCRIGLSIFGIQPRNVTIYQKNGS